MFPLAGQGVAGQARRGVGGDNLVSPVCTQVPYRGAGARQRGGAAAGAVTQSVLDGNPVRGPGLGR